jgi:UDP-2,3-diacylglucosamine hydrolase
MGRPLTLSEMKPLDLGSLNSGVSVCISDVHLEERSVRSGGLLADFLDRVEADRIFILGDLFDFWTGRDNEAIPVFSLVVEALRRCLSRGIRLVVLRGNRDFLAQSFWRQRVGATTADNAVVFTAGGLLVLLTHGDALCTWDSRYGAWRRLCSTRALGELADSLPFGAGRLLGRMARRGSELELRIKPRCPVEVFEGGLRSLYRDGVDVVVAGHIHVPADCTKTIGGRPRRLLIIGGWEEEPRYLEIKGGDFNLKRIPDNRGKTAS